MVDSRSALFSRAGVTGAGRRSRISVLALLLAGAAMTASPGSALTYNLMDGTVDRTDFIDPTTLKEADFVENGGDVESPCAQRLVAAGLLNGGAIF